MPAPEHSEARYWVLSNPNIYFKCLHPNKTCWFWFTLLSYSKRSLQMILKARYLCLNTMCKYIFMYTHSNNFLHKTHIYVVIKCLSRPRLRNDLLHAVYGFYVLSSLSFLLSSYPTFISQFKHDFLIGPFSECPNQVRNDYYVISYHLLTFYHSTCNNL